MGKENKPKQKEENRLSILDLYKEFREFKDEFRTEISEIKQTLNNGLTAKTKSNTKIIKELNDKFEILITWVNKQEGFDKGKTSIWNIIKFVAAGFAAGIGTTLSIIKILQALNII